ncbi:iron-containing alcohol dehydrogenase [Candidatus Berkelbacteria bacterium]|nr:iron-containing alcohol dehydrogenase [Candidatus Berkelbacteria bacterium]
MPWSYHLPTQITFGEGVFRDIDRWWLAKLGRRVGLITSPSQQARAVELKVCARWDKITSNPSVATLQSLIKWVKSESLTGLVALGGGSVIDSAKVASVLACQDISLVEALTRKTQLVARHLPLIACPTTAGTGAEVTKWATVWGDDLRKYSFEHELAYPLQAVIDPELTYSLPRQITASTGLDAFAQAIEAYWSRNTQPLSQTLALRAIELIYATLPKAVDQPKDGTARHDMALGSLLAGLAFTGTRTTACHAISYPMTAHFGVPHGFAVALTLPNMLRFNAESFVNFSTFVKALDADSIEAAAKRIEQLMQVVGAPTTLAAAKVPKTGLQTILDEGFHPDRVIHNPRELDRQSLSEMLTKIAN